MLVLKDIDITLGDRLQLRHKVFNQLSLSVDPGEFVVVIGNNGAGKTTLFNVIMGALKPDSGQVILNGNEAYKISHRARTALISKVAQDPRIGTMENMTIFENMALALKRGQRRNYFPFRNRTRKQIFQEKLNLLGMGLETRLNELAGSLSGGQRQALSLIMAILTDSKILLLDEITAALDPKTADHVMALANKIIYQEKRTCLMITHNMTHAIKYGTRLLILNEGKFIREYAAFKKSTLTRELLAAEFI